ncbi:hypothetical protein DV515_00006572, partial [Chloebia gouldiae]
MTNLIGVVLSGKVIPKYCWRKKGKSRKTVNTLNGFPKSSEFSMPDSAPVARTFMAAVSFALGSNGGKKKSHDGSCNIGRVDLNVYRKDKCSQSQHSQPSLRHTDAFLCETEKGKASLAYRGLKISDGHSMFKPLKQDRVKHIVVSIATGVKSKIHLHPRKTKKMLEPC